MAWSRTYFGKGIFLKPKWAITASDINLLSKLRMDLQRNHRLAPMRESVLFRSMFGASDPLLALAGDCKGRSFEFSTTRTGDNRWRRLVAEKEM